MRLLFGVMAALTASPSMAEVVKAGPGGFELTATVSIAAPAQRVWDTLRAPARWWSADHTYSGDAGNLRIDAQAGGCFCEALPDKGSIEHARVIYAQPAKLLRLQGALGPLQAEAATGTLTFALAPAAGNATKVTMTYVVGGYFRGGGEALAPLVDQVMGQQLQGLKGASQVAAHPAAAMAATPLLPDQGETLSALAPAVLPLRERAAIQNAWLRERLDTLVPRLMRAAKVDMWILVAREYAEDPVLSTMLDAESFHARRRTILVFHDPGGGKAVERLTVSRYGLADLFAPAWKPEEQPDQWKALAAIVAARRPARIAVNVSPATAFGDGLTKGQYDELAGALGGDAARIVSAESLAVGWLETRTAAELARYPEIVRVAHAIIAQGFSTRAVTPGKTTAADLVWWYREKIAAMKLATWFQPSVAIFRRGAQELSGDTVIQPGDMLWVDFGITYLGLNTDTQHLAYVLRPGEREAPRGLRDGLSAANGVQDAVTGAFAVGRTGNEILVAARKAALAKGLQPTIYSHPIGYHGHAAGSAIGFWDDQQPSPRGEHPVVASTAWSIELAATHAVPEWGGQEVRFRLEEDAWFDGTRVRYIDGRQTRFHLIGPVAPRQKKRRR